jgi:hypothetical protein
MLIVLIVKYIQCGFEHPSCSIFMHSKFQTPFFERTSFPTTMVKMTRFLRLPLLPITREINGYAI